MARSSGALPVQVRSLHIILSVKGSHLSNLERSRRTSKGDREIQTRGVGGKPGEGSITKTSEGRISRWAKRGSTEEVPLSLAMWRTRRVLPTTISEVWFQPTWSSNPISGIRFTWWAPVG